MSSFAWLDSSPEARRRVLDALAVFKNSDARHELGLASVRDGFANTFFPGTGTLQTSAGYFLFVPWIYRILRDKGVGSAELARLARQEETKLIKALLADGETTGVIGRIARERLQRLPSSIYWKGLRSWGIFQLDLTIDEYHRQFEQLHGSAKGRATTTTAAAGTRPPHRPSEDEIVNEGLAHHRAAPRVKSADRVATFVEVQLPVQPALPSPGSSESKAGGQTVVELTGTGGARMRIDVIGTSNVDIVGLAQALWSREP